MAEGRFINVRKLAALDLHFRGTRFILFEFGFVVFGLGGLGAYALFSPNRGGTVEGIGGYLLLLAIDYLPLLLYSISISRTGSAEREAQPEASNPRAYRTRYGVQQVLLVVPLVVPLLALTQEFSHGSTAKES